VIDPFAETDSDFLGSTLAALSTVAPEEALNSLGWSDLLPHLDDADARQALFGLFRAQGRLLVNSSALATLMAHPYLANGWGSTSHVATIQRESPRHGSRTVIMSTPPIGNLLIDRPGEGVRIVASSEVAIRPIDLPGHVNLQEVEVDLVGVPIAIPEEEAAILRAQSQYLGRTALAFDMLGASESALKLAVDHARDREQFGQPIGSFQAVRHLLAWARVDCAALSAVAEQVIDSEEQFLPGYDAIVKALAGRNGQRVCQRTLQVLGAIGFTTEHQHHHFYSRILCMDSLLGSSAALSYELASKYRTSMGAFPDVTLHAAVQAN
jgi:hypothetical protein